MIPVVGLVLLLSGAAIYLFWASNSRARSHAEGYVQIKTKVEIQMFLQAMETYQLVYGTYPSGSASNIIRCLKGDNSEKLCVLAMKSSRTNGEILDVWGTPYKISVGPTNQVSIRSAGKNRVFGDKDDLEEHNP
jgi:Type II secretion system (T2SS), protein G